MLLKKINYSQKKDVKLKRNTIEMKSINDFWERNQDADPSMLNLNLLISYLMIQCNYSNICILIILWNVLIQIWYSLTSQILRISQAGGNFRRSLALPGAQSKIISEITPSCLWICSVWSSKPPGFVAILGNLF